LIGRRIETRIVSARTDVVGKHAEQEAIVENEQGRNAARDALADLERRVDAAIEEVRPKVKRALEELDARVDAAMTEIRPRLDEAMEEVRPRVDRFLTDVQPRLDSILHRLEARIAELRKDLEARAAREEPGEPAGTLPPAEPSPGPGAPEGGEAAGTE
jgi:tetrahydromethanopterin S-methyltransferase subunit G